MATDTIPSTITTPYSTREVRRRLDAIYARGEAAALTRIVCCEMMGMSQSHYFAGEDMHLTASQRERLQEILERLERYEPIQYIQGCTTFCGLDFIVRPGVLIPRPETEELVQSMKEELPKGSRILDIGTGSGCIAISLAVGIPGAQVTAWDLSPEALAVAFENARGYAVDVRLELRDVFDDLYPADPIGGYDVIVSNPPYVRLSEQSSMECNVLDWEPHEALFVPDEDPLKYYRRIGEIGRKLLAPHGYLYLEINRAFGAEVVQLLAGQGYHRVKVHPDRAGLDRYVTAMK